MASMEEAAQIRDVAARHAYVFDNGLSSPDFFDVEKRMASEEFRLIAERCDPDHGIVEIGCFTGLNLLGLGRLKHRPIAERKDYKYLTGIEFVKGAADWLWEQSWKQMTLVNVHRLEFPKDWTAPRFFDRAICFDVLEHQQNVGQFLNAVSNCLLPDGKALFLVPAGSNYFDCGHCAFFSNCDCLRNVLDYHMEVEEIFELKTCQKLFACCKRRDA